MYDDYPTIYETTLNQNLIYFIILGMILLIILLITFFALAKVFKKANRTGIAAIIPIYNMITLLEITNSSKWNLLFFLIPGVNIIFYLLVMFKLAKTFRKSKSFAFGLVFLPFIFFPILAFGKSEYIGIDLVAREGKSIVTDVPKIVEEDKKPIVHEEKDTSLKNINISIGGGVYQKDYTKTLLQVDEKQTISSKDKDFIENQSSIPNRPLNDNIDSSKLSFVAPIKDEIEKPKEEPKDISTSFVEQINSIEEKKEEKVETTTMNNPEVTPQPIKIEEQPSFTINPEVQHLTDNQLREKSEFISCPKCGAKIKSDAKVCFLCGKKFE